MHKTTQLPKITDLLMSDAFSVMYPDAHGNSKYRLMLIPKYLCPHPYRVTDARIELVTKDMHIKNIHCVRLDTDANQNRLCMIKHGVISADGVPLLLNSRRELDNISMIRYIWKTSNGNTTRYHAAVYDVEFAHGANFSLDNINVPPQDFQLLYGEDKGQNKLLNYIGNFCGIFRFDRTENRNIFCLTLKDTYRTGCSINPDGSVFYGPAGVAVNILNLPEDDVPYVFTACYTKCILHDPLSYGNC